MGRRPKPVRIEHEWGRRVTNERQADWVRCYPRLHRSEILSFGKRNHHISRLIRPSSAFVSWDAMKHYLIITTKGFGTTPGREAVISFQGEKP